MPRERPSPARQVSVHHGLCCVMDGVPVGAELLGGRVVRADNDVSDQVVRGFT